MALVAVGGHSRNVGKTSVVEGLIRALPDFAWTAMKITQFGHGVCSANGEPCDCATDQHALAVSEERDRSGESDTSRFLVAGAQRVYWVRTQQGRLAEAMPKVRTIIEQATNVIVESNSIVKFVRPDLYIVVLDPSNKDFKDSAREMLDRASAVLLHGGVYGAAEWEKVSVKPIRNVPVFSISHGNYVTPELVEFVRQKLASRMALTSNTESI